MIIKKKIIISIEITKTYMNISKMTVDTISDDVITLDVKDTVLDARNIMMKYNISRVGIINKKRISWDNY